MSPAPSRAKLRILVADDQLELLSLMKDTLEAENFSIETASDGQQALDKIRAQAPDIAVIDLWMPNKDGFAVCKELKADPGLQYLPIILLSGAGTQGDKIQGMDIGADDFVTKPVDLMELVARIRRILSRTQQNLDANPLTRLPGNVSIQNRINAGIAKKRPLAILYLDLNGFKAYNDVYGYDSGDRVIKATAEIILNVVKSGKKKDFIGHIGGDDFIVVTEPERMEQLSQSILEGFDQIAPNFYKEEDRRKGKIITQDRQGKTTEFPLLSIAIGICHNKYRALNSYGQISQIGAELKKYAKRSPGSHYVVDRRRE